MPIRTPSMVMAFSSPCECAGAPLLFQVILHDGLVFHRGMTVGHNQASRKLNIVTVQSVLPEILSNGVLHFV